MRTFVSVVICVVLGVPAAAVAARPSSHLLRDASRLSGLRVKRPVRTASLSSARYAALFSRTRTDANMYRPLGLTRRSAKPSLSRAWYDAATRRLFVQRRAAPGRRALIQEYVRALIDQNYGFGHRVAGLRARDHDGWLAATAMVDGTAALASGLHAPALHGTPLDRFSALESTAGVGPGRALAAQLHYLGGRAAVASALHTFPQTTEQLLHVDKFLQRERALPVTLPNSAGGAPLVASETFGELDVRNLLQAFAVPSAATAADGWGGGRFALYGDVAVVLLRFDTPDDAAEWQAAVPPYVAAAFPDAVAHECPPLDRCWSGAGEVAAGVYGTTAVLASGPHAAAVAAALL